MYKTDNLNKDLSYWNCSNKNWKSILKQGMT